MLTTDGLEKQGDFLAQLRKAIKRGLSRDDALRALTANPAEVLGIDQQLGSIEAGKIANLVVADGDLFDKGNVITTWVNGTPYEIKSEPIVTFAGRWKLSAAEPIGDMKHWRLTISGKPEKPSASINRLNEPAEQKPTADATEESKEAEPGEESSDETKKVPPEALGTGFKPTS